VPAVHLLGFCCLFGLLQACIVGCFYTTLQGLDIWDRFLSQPALQKLLRKDRPMIICHLTVMQVLKKLFQTKHICDQPAAMAGSR